MTHKHAIKHKGSNGLEWIRDKEVSDIRFVCLLPNRQGGISRGLVVGTQSQI